MNFLMINAQGHLIVINSDTLQTARSWAEEIRFIDGVEWFRFPSGVTAVVIH